MSKVANFARKVKNKIKPMASDKFFKNPYPDYTEERASEIILDGKPHPKSNLISAIEQKWKDTMKALDKIDSRDNTVYTGSSGIALLKYRKDPEDRKVLQEVLDLLQLEKCRNKRHTFLCGDAGPLALGILVNHRLGNQEQVWDLVGKLKSMQSAALDLSSDLPNEYMYGRAGYLYALLFVNRCVQPKPIDDDLIRNVVEAILKVGQIEAKNLGTKSPLMYQWHGSYYLGAAHGLTGIIYLLLEAKEYLQDKEIKTLVKPTIDYLGTLRFESGNFPSSLGREQDKYVQWCHGAPGFLYMFCQAFKVFGEEKYLKIALKCGDVIWQRGLLRKGYSICHGVSGNGYCFLELYRTTNDKKHLYRALKFAEWCLDYSKSHEEHHPDRPLSLYEGIAGPMFFLLDILHPEQAKFPGFTL